MTAPEGSSSAQRRIVPGRVEPGCCCTRERIVNRSELKPKNLTSPCLPIPCASSQSITVHFVRSGRAGIGWSVNSSPSYATGSSGCWHVGMSYRAVKVPAYLFENVVHIDILPYKYLVRVSNLGRVSRLIRPELNLCVYKRPCGQLLSSIRFISPP